MDRQSLAVPFAMVAGFLTGTALMLYDEILTAAFYHYCYPYPFAGCYGPYLASAVPFVLIMAAVFFAALSGAWCRR